MSVEGRRAQLRQQALVKQAVDELVGAGAYPELAAKDSGWSIELPTTDGLIRVSVAASLNRQTELRTWMRAHRAEGRWTALVHPGWRLAGQVRRTPQLHMPFEDFARLYGRLEFLERDNRRLLDYEH